MSGTNKRKQIESDARQQDERANKRKKRTSLNSQTDAGQTDAMAIEPAVDRSGSAKTAEEKAERNARKKERKQARRDELDKSKGEGQIIVHKPKPPKKRDLEKKAAKRQGVREKKVKVHISNLRPEVAPILDEPWSLQGPSGGRFLDHDPIFRQDPSGIEYVITANAREVQVISLDTSLVVRSLTAPDGTTVVAFDKSAATSRSKTLRVAYSDGSFRDWDWTVADSTPEKNPIFSRGHVEAFAQVDAGANTKDTIIYTTKERKRSEIIAGVQGIYSTKGSLQSLQVLGKAAYVVTSTRSSLIVGRRNFEKPEAMDFTWAELPAEGEITCFDARLSRITSADRRAKSPEQLSIALGYRYGQIHLFEDVNFLFAKDKTTSTPPRIMHWHRDAVSSVKFSRDGNYLISGGKETVLVIWQLATGQQQYLPHLTSEIEKVVVNEAGDKYALQLGDNSIMVLSTSELRPIANLAGIQMSTALTTGKDGTAALPALTATMHPSKVNELLLAVPPSQPKRASDFAASRPFVQTFDLSASRHISRQAFTRNTVTDFNVGPDKDPIVSPDLKHIAISPEGDWLATIDEWMPPSKDVAYLADNDAAILEERNKRREVYLKIWTWSEILGLWTLTTRVDSPHPRVTGETWGAGAVLALVASPASDAFATLGEDGIVKLWTPKTRMRSGVPLQDDAGRDLIEWRCKQSIELENAGSRADSPMQDMMTAIQPQGCLTYTPDGSMLAASQSSGDIHESPSIHLINAFTGTVTTQKRNVAGPGLKQIAFIGHSLAILNQASLRLWDLVRDELNHPVRLASTIDHSFGDVHMAVDAEDEVFAIAVPGNEQERASLRLFKAKGSKCVCEIWLNAGNPIVGLSSGKGRKGFVVLFADGTVRTLQQDSVLAREYTGAENVMDVTAPTADIEAGAMASFDVEEEMADAGAAEEPLQLEDDAEDDRPVVQPEQLAGLFDVGQSFALPSVRDMFRGIVGLYGRPPRARVAESAVN